jgi:hypothetical protein
VIERGSIYWADLGPPSRFVPGAGSMEAMSNIVEMNIMMTSDGDG